MSKPQKTTTLYTVIPLFPPEIQPIEGVEQPSRYRIENNGDPFFISKEIAQTTEEGAVDFFLDKVQKEIEYLELQLQNRRAEKYSVIRRFKKAKK